METSLSQEFLEFNRLYKEECDIYRESPCALARPQRHQYSLRHIPAGEAEHPERYLRKFLSQ